MSQAEGQVAPRAAGEMASERRRGLALAQAARDGYLLLLALPHALRRYVEDGCAQWAAALAYFTLIGLVPLLATLFAVMKVLGLHRDLTPFIVTTIGAGSREVAVPIVEFIDKTNVAALGLIGSVAAILAVAGILGNVELAFNVIWGRVPGRSWWRKIRAYAAVAFTAPAMLSIALAVTALFRPGSGLSAMVEGSYISAGLVFLLRLVPYALLWVMFSIMYTVLPNAHVPLRSAVGGALVAGTMWQLAQWTYVTFMIAVVRHSAFYGALWQLPILLVWTYIGWLIVLFGAEVCAEHHRRSAAPAPYTPAVPAPAPAVPAEAEWPREERWEL